MMECRSDFIFLIENLLSSKQRKYMAVDPSSAAIRTLKQRQDLLACTWCLGTLELLRNNLFFTSAGLTTADTSFAFAGSDPVVTHLCMVLSSTVSVLSVVVRLSAYIAPVSSSTMIL